MSYTPEEAVEEFAGGQVADSRMSPSEQTEFWLSLASAFLSNAAQDDEGEPSDDPERYLQVWVIHASLEGDDAVSAWRSETDAVKGAEELAAEWGMQREGADYYWEDDQFSNYIEITGVPLR